MDSRTELLKTWAINKIKTEYADDVALLIAVDGRSVDGDGHGECFDYFIPATERGYELNQTFIVEGIGYDLYPRSWERTEGTAMFEEGPQACLARARILYSHSIEEEDRFIQLQQRFHDNLKNTRFMYEKGLEKIEVAMQLYSSLIFQEKLYQNRMTTGYLSNYLSQAIAYLNGTYLDTCNSEILQTLAVLPSDFLACYQLMLQAHSKEELNRISFEMLKSVRKLFANYKKLDSKDIHSVDYSNLAEWYQELSLTFRRMRYYCREKNAGKVYENACCLQSEMEIIRSEFGLKEMDLMGAFDSRNLEAVMERSSQLEEYIVNEIVSHGIKVRKYDTVWEFLNHN